MLAMREFPFIFWCDGLFCAIVFNECQVLQMNDQKIGLEIDDAEKERDSGGRSNLSKVKGRLEGKGATGKVRQGIR